MTVTGLPAPAWEQIRGGRRPESQNLATVAETDVATDGLGGAAALRGSLQAQLLGAGPLEPLLELPGVTDVAVNGDGSVWVDAGAGLVRVDVDVGGPDAVRRLAVRLAGLAGRRLDETSPYVDGVLPSGVRLHAILPPLVADGPHLTLRIPARSAMTLTELEARSMFPPGWAGLLRQLVRRRVAFVVSGGTGVGKTTLLGALLGEAPAAERVIVVEDVRELSVDQPQVVRLEARPANVEGAGEVTLTTLVRQALRMRPDRLVLGRRAAPRSVSCWPPSTPGTRVAAARCTRTAPAMSSRGSRRSGRSRACRPQRCTLSSSVPWTSSCTSAAGPQRGRFGVRSRRSAWWFEVPTDDLRW